jgi:hypothetical protein
MLHFDNWQGKARQVNCGFVWDAKTVNSSLQAQCVPAFAVCARLASGCVQSSSAPVEPRLGARDKRIKPMRAGGGSGNEFPEFPRPQACRGASGYGADHKLLWSARELEIPSLRDRAAPRARRRNIERIAGGQFRGVGEG